MSEQGLGDTLQFALYALALQNQGVDVTVLSQSPMVELLRNAIGLRQVEDRLDLEEQQKRNPLWLPMMNLAPLMGCTTDKIPHSDGYLQADSDAIGEWKTRLQRKPDHQLIAIHWQGNPEHEQSIYSRGRSLPFSDMLKLQGVDKIEFVSIQKGKASEQLRIDQGLNFVIGQEAVNKSMDLCETAAVIANCDLVITSDSCVAHLSGAMGIPTWLGLRWIPEWRWGLEGRRTDWYKSMHLFRQDFDGNWGSVIKEIRQKLNDLPRKKELMNELE